MKSRFKVGTLFGPVPTLREVLGAKYPPRPSILRKTRIRFRLTQAGMSQRIGVTEDTWARWERGDQLPHPLMYCGLIALVRVWPLPKDQSRKPPRKGFKRGSRKPPAA